MMLGRKMNRPHLCECNHCIQLTDNVICTMLYPSSWNAGLSRTQFPVLIYIQTDFIHILEIIFDLHKDYFPHFNVS